LMTTVTGPPSSGAVPDQLQVPLVLPLCVTEPGPDCTLMVTGSSTSEKLPVLVTLDRSAALTLPLLLTVGAASAPATAPVVVVVWPPSSATVRLKLYQPSSAYGCAPLTVYVPPLPLTVRPVVEWLPSPQFAAVIVKSPPGAAVLASVKVAPERVAAVTPSTPP